MSWLSNFAKKNPILKEIAGSLIRNAMTGGGIWFVAKGLGSPETYEAIVGGVMAGVGVIASVINADDKASLKMTVRQGIIDDKIQPKLN